MDNKKKENIIAYALLAAVIISSLFTLYQSASFVSAAPSNYCCVNSSSDAFCHSGSASNYDSLVSACGSADNVTPGLCTDTGSVGEQVCSATSGCCCEYNADGSISNADLTNKLSCSGQWLGPYPSGTTCSNVCQPTQPTNNCDPTQVNLKASPVKGSSDVTLTWDSCGPSSISIIKTNVSSGQTTSITVDSAQNTYTDSNTQWDSSYKYDITLNYPSPTPSSYKGSAQITTGNDSCKGVTSSNRVCYSGSYAYDIIQCNSDNKVVYTDNCGTLQCQQTGDTAICANSQVTCSSNSLLGSTTKNECDGTSGNPRYCFYDRGPGIINQCYSCSLAQSCFDYKSKDACETNNCGLSGCYWDPTADVGQGGGICKSSTTDICSFISNLKGNNPSSYSPLMTPTPKDSVLTLFSTTNFTCVSVQGSCGNPASCEALDNQTDACTNSQSTCGISCAVKSVNGNNICTRVDSNQKTPCAQLSGSERTACELATGPPKTACSWVNTANPTFTVTVFDAQTEPVTSPYSNGYTTTICLKNLTDSSDTCVSDTGTTQLDTTNFQLPYLKSKFSSIKPDSSYRLLLETKDAYGNTENSYASCAFSTPSNIDNLNKYVIVAVSPNPLQAYAKSKFRVTVQPTQNTQKCTYSLNGGVTTDMTPDSSKTRFTTYNLSLSSSGNLKVTCTPSDTGTFKTNTTNFPIEIIGQGDRPSISLSAMPQYIFTKTDAYHTTLKINSNQLVSCKYSDDPKATYSSMTSVPGGYDNTFSVPLKFTAQGNYTILVQCQNGLGLRSDYSSIKITADSNYKKWTTIIKPKNLGWYNSNVLPVTIKAIPNATCTASGYSEIKQPTFTIPQDNDTVNLGNVKFNQSTNNFGVECTYVDMQGNQHTSSDRVTFFYDDAVPKIGISIFGQGEKATGAYNDKLQFSISFNSSGVDLNQMVYNITEENVNQTYLNTIRKDTSITVQNKTGNNIYSTTVSGLSLSQKNLYRITATISNVAGSNATATANYVYDPAQVCQNNVTDPQETDLNCGGVCGATCNVGQTCKSNSDCLDNLACDKTIAQCVPGTCFNNKQDGSETGVDCGGDCKPCVDKIWLEKPQFGISPTPNPKLTFGTIDNSNCKYQTSEMESNGISSPLTSDENPSHTSKTHTLYTTISDGESDTYNIICFNGTGNYSRRFDISVDSKAPKVTSYDLRPDIITQQYNIGLSGQTAYWTQLSITTDKPSVCRYSIQNEPYKEMSNYVGDKTTINESKIVSYSLTHNVYVPFTKEGDYNLYMSCIGENGVVTPAVSKNLKISKTANVKPEILTPVSSRIYNTTSINATVDAGSNTNFACMAKPDNFDYNNLTKVQGSIYSKSFSYPNQGSHTTTAVCDYKRITGEKYNSSASTGFRIDTEPPTITKFSIMDPNTKNRSVTHHKNAIALDIESSDAISGTAYYNYTIYVDGNEQVSRKVNAQSTYFEENGLYLQNDSKIKADVIAEDKAGNIMKTAKESNTLTYVYSVPPSTCNDNVTDGNETGVDCGGSCQSCTNNQVCKGNADCQAGSYCGSSGVCLPRQDHCTNHKLDAGLETGVDCGGECGACTTAGANCTSNSDCDSSKGLYCDSSAGICKLDIQRVCSNGQLDSAFETGVDCGGICAAKLDLACKQDGGCSSSADCEAGLVCSAGTCQPDNRAPPKPSYCSNNEFNNTINDSGKTAYCGDSCDTLCPVGVGCRNDRDCKSNACDTAKGICVSSNVCSGTAVLQNGNPCGGSCTNNKCTEGLFCLKDSDCDVGLVCGTDNTCTTKSVVSSPGNGENNNGNNQSSSRSGLWWKILLMIFLLVILGGVGYYAYITYYLPNKKPEYNDEGQNAQGQDGVAGHTDVSSHPQNAVEPPRAPPLSPEKQKQIDELLRKKRREEKKKEMQNLFSAFDETKLTGKESSPKAKQEASAPHKTENVSGEKAQEDIKKSMPSFDEMPEKAQNSIKPEDKKPPKFRNVKEPEIEPVIPVRKKKSYDTFKKILDNGKKNRDVKNEEQKK